jgi:hypothetical protein
MLYRPIYSLAFALVAIFQIVSTAAAGAPAPAAPTIDKTTVIIRANTFSDWDSKANTDKYGWVPDIDMRVNGPISSGSVISFEMTTPDGRPWVSADCETSPVAAGETFKIESCGRDLRKVKTNKRESLGMYGLKISLKNELQGSNTELFSGKFKVSKIFYGDVPQDKNNYLWYVD